MLASSDGTRLLAKHNVSPLCCYVLILKKEKLTDHIINSNHYTTSQWKQFIYNQQVFSSSCLEFLLEPAGCR